MEKVTSVGLTVLCCGKIGWMELMADVCVPSMVTNYVFGLPLVHVYGLLRISLCIQLVELSRSPYVGFSRRMVNKTLSESLPSPISRLNARWGTVGNLRLLHCRQDSTLLIAVEENTTVMRAKAGDLLGNGKGAGRWVTVSSYLEAVGVLVAHKAGVNPACLTTHVSPARKMPSITSSDYGRARGDMLGRNTQFRDQRETLHAAPT